MEVYLIRHGIAAEKGTYADDEQRPLIKKGQDKTAQVAQRLLSVGLKFDLLLSSPLVRAYQTAEILQQASLAKTIETFAPLKPDGAIAEWVKWQQQYQVQHPDAKIALVGHQPDLGNWAEMMLWGAIQGQIEVKKAGVMGLKIPPIGTPIARSTLFLHVPPKWLI
ncbi:phosphohistidine phosphatase SixA [Pleurocapsa sp. CCALA 161]|uniref:phosphohistidine phosphatase SixA n=1 Tax=Pleurocapsa sp. CCALA 161 TaxID=2107688 RepID=UPI000D0839F3|nr:phosphohistidine phosphatase SixA [Pleurocapsa sp. CCALA 161]PSB12366.1 phosphohistidine phosphatase SixA [Pleurocapsa sp. CCALA 161]